MERPRRNGVNYESSTPVNPSPRTRSTVLNIRRKQLILSFKGKDVQDIGTEAWANRLYTHVKKEDESIAREDITRWIASHSWISDLNGVPKMQTPLKRGKRGNRGGSASVTPPSPVAPPPKPKSAPPKKASPKVVFPKKASPPKDIINEEESQSETEDDVAGEVRNASHVSTIEQETLQLSEEEVAEEEGEDDEEEEGGEPEENEARNKADDEDEEEEVDVEEEEDDNEEDEAKNKADEDEEEDSEEEDEEDDSEEDSNTADDEMSFASTKKTNNPYNPKLARP